MAAFKDPCAIVARLISDVHFRGANRILRERIGALLRVFLGMYCTWAGFSTLGVGSSPGNESSTLVPASLLWPVLPCIAEPKSGLHEFCLARILPECCLGLGAHPSISTVSCSGVIWLRLCSRSLTPFS